MVIPAAGGAAGLSAREARWALMILDEVSPPSIIAEDTL